MTADMWRLLDVCRIEVRDLLVNRLVTASAEGGALAELEAGPPRLTGRRRWSERALDDLQNRWIGPTNTVQQTRPKEQNQHIINYISVYNLTTLGIPLGGAGIDRDM